MRVPMIVAFVLPLIAVPQFAVALGPRTSQVNARTPLVYVSDVTNNVIDIFDFRGRQMGELTKGLSAPVGMFVDGQHRLWVANSGANDVLVYERGARTPSKTLTQDGQFHPNDITLCPDGTAFVANAFNAGGIAVYPPGKTKPSRYLQPELSGAGGDEFFVTCDAMGNVFANGLIGLSPVLATTGWLHGRQSGYAFISYAFDGGIKATPRSTLLTNGFVSGQPAVVEISELGVPLGNALDTSPDAWADIAINPRASVVFGADMLAREGILHQFPSGSGGYTYESGNLVNPQGIAFDPGSPR